MAQEPTETIQIQATADFSRQFHEEAKRLNLSLSAFLMYLFQRRSLSAKEMAELDSDVRQVFGKHGELMRRLAK